MPRKVLHSREGKWLSICASVCVPERLPAAVSSKALFKGTSLDCVCNKASTKRGLLMKKEMMPNFQADPSLINVSRRIPTMFGWV